jgi:hypothetical protein
MANEIADFRSPYYPFKKVITGANTLRGAEIVPYKILLYLMDLPDAAGYSPPDDNDYPRTRLKKYLWYDTPNPLSQPIPTAQQVRSMLFDPDEPDINSDEMKAKHPHGYRLFAQRMINSSVLDAKTILKVYPGRILDTDDFRTILGFQAEIWCNTSLITNTRTTAYDRCFDIEQCLREALSGVDIAGVGTIRFSRQDSSYNGSEVLYTDAEISGRMLYFSTAWSEGGGGTVKTFL